MANEIALNKEPKLSKFGGTSGLNLIICLARDRLAKNIDRGIGARGGLKIQNGIELQAQRSPQPLGQSQRAGTGIGPC